MLARKLFICSAIEKCQETVNCCPHKKPHIKDERCVPRECRYAPDVESIDCDPYDPEHPRVPGQEPVAQVKTVEQTLKEVAGETVVDQILKEKIIEKVKEDIASIPGIELVGDIKVETFQEQEQDIKEAVKKQAASKKPAKSAKKGGKKVS